MTRIVKTHHWAATFDGLHPETSRRCVEASSFEELQYRIEAEGYTPAQVRKFYRLHIEADTSWGDVDDSTNYVELLAKLTRDLRSLGKGLLADSPITEVTNSEPRDEALEAAQRDWDSDYTT